MTNGELRITSVQPPKPAALTNHADRSDFGLFNHRSHGEGGPTSDFGL